MTQLRRTTASGPTAAPPLLGTACRGHHVKGPNGLPWTIAGTCTGGSLSICAKTQPVAHAKLQTMQHMRDVFFCFVRRPHTHRTLDLTCHSVHSELQEKARKLLLSELARECLCDQSSKTRPGGDSPDASIPLLESSHGGQHETLTHFLRHSGSGKVFRCRHQELKCLSVLQTCLENLIGATPWPTGTPGGRCLKALCKLARIQDQRVLTLPEGWGSPSLVVAFLSTPEGSLMREQRPSVHDGLRRPALSQPDSELPAPRRRCSSPASFGTFPPAMLRGCSDEVAPPAP